MTEDEKLAEEWLDERYLKNMGVRRSCEEAFLAGLKAARQEKWHDLRKNPKGLPEENQEVLVYFTLPDKSRNSVAIAQFKSNDFDIVDLQDVIAWCEIPTFKE